MLNRYLLRLITLCCFVFMSLLGQKVHSLSSNSYVSEFFLSGPYFHDKEKEIKPVKMLEIGYIDNENLFTNSETYSDGQVIRSNDGSHNVNSFLDDSSFAAAYLFTQVYAAKPTEAYFLLSVTDGAKIYVNGKKI